MERYQADLEKLTQLVRDADGDALGKIFLRAKTARDRFVDQLEN